MAAIHRSLDTQQKLSILSQDSQYDLACACGTKTNADHRVRTTDNRWLYPVSLPNGGTSVILKTLISNVCTNDCGYCPLRLDQDHRRCSLSPQEVVRVFLNYYRARKVFGLFISSGVQGSADATMDKINEIAYILRKKEHFTDYIHLKIIPGASDAAIEQAVSLANNVSVNIEVPGVEHFKNLCKGKDYINDVIRPIKLISRLTGKGMRHSRVGQTTQFVVGASAETDQEIVKYCGGLYTKLGMKRVYFSAYQRGKGRGDLPGEKSLWTNEQLLTREHRLYQVDWLLRKYHFSVHEIPFDQKGNLPLKIDPKEQWAVHHPEFFPVNINTASKWQLLRVPGLGEITVSKILKMRENRYTIKRIHDLGTPGKRLLKAEKFISF